MSTELPSLPKTTRKLALEHGAALIEQELRKLRKRAMHADGNPYDEQYHVDPVPEAERTFLSAVELAASAAMLREMARHEEVSNG